MLDKWNSNVSQGSSLTIKLGHQSNVVKVTRERNLQTPQNVRLIHNSAKCKTDSQLGKCKTYPFSVDLKVRFISSALVTTNLISSA